MEKSTNKLYLISILMLLIFGITATADDVNPPLDRGHRVLVEKGLQIMAVVDPVNNDYFSPEDWIDSHFTGAMDTRQYPDMNLYVKNWSVGNYPYRSGYGDNGRDYVASRTVTEAQLPYLHNLVGWKLRDEQDMSDSLHLAQAKLWMDSVHADPDYDHVILFTNQPGLGPSVTTLRNYMSLCQPDMLNFDAYPFDDGSYFGTVYSPDILYQPLAKYRMLGLEGNDGTGDTPIPYGLYLQTFLYDQYNYYHPSESQIRFNQFAAWAFGFKYATAFIYDEGYDESVNTLMFDGGGVDPDRTVEFDYVAETNRQSVNLGKALVRLLSTDIRIKKGAATGQSQTTDVADWASNINDTYITGIKDPNRGDSLTSGDVLIGYFEPLHEDFDGPDYSGQTYFMIVNGAVKKSTDAGSGAFDMRQWLKITFDLNGSGLDGSAGLQRMSRDTGLVENIALVSEGSGVYSLTFMLEGGTGDLFKFNTGAPFVGTYNKPDAIVVSNTGSGDWEKRFGDDITLINNGMVHSAGQREFLPTLDGGMVTFSPAQDLLVKWAPNMNYVQKTVPGDFNDVVILKGGDIVGYNAETNLLELYSGSDLTFLDSQTVAGEYKYLTSTDDGGLVGYSVSQALIVKLNPYNSYWVGPTSGMAGVTDIIKLDNGDIAVCETQYDYLRTYDSVSLEQKSYFGIAGDQSFMTPGDNGVFYSYSSSQGLFVKWSPGAINSWGITTYDTGGWDVNDMIILSTGNLVAYESTHGYLRQFSGDDLSQVNYQQASLPSYMTPLSDGGFVSYDQSQSLLVKWDPTLSWWPTHTVSMYCGGIGVLNDSLPPIDCSEAGYEGYLNPMDFDGNCAVDLKDFADFAGEWTECVDPVNDLCDEPWLLP